MSLKDFIAESSGGAYFPFKTVGTRIEGTVISATQRQANDFDTGKPMFWDNGGDPMFNIVVTLKTELHDSTIPNDDGTRDVWIKWWGSSKPALLSALRAAGADDIIAGGHFTAEFSSVAPSSMKGGSPIKVFTYTYRLPSVTPVVAEAVTAGVDVAKGNGTSAANYPGRPGNPPRPGTVADVPAAEPAPTRDPVAEVTQIRALAGMGLTPEAIQAAVPAWSLGAIAAVMNIPASVG